MKNNSNDFEIKSVSDFLDHKFKALYTSTNSPGRFIYRGLTDYDYKLIPSVGRLFGKEPFLKKEDLLHFEQSAFAEFRIMTYNELREKDPFILLAVAQHHGLKTRLLDWTFSPLIALFFAVENNKPNKCDGALVAFQTQFLFNDFQGISGPFDEGLKEHHFIFAPSLSPRIRAQQGVFQLFKDPTQEFKDARQLFRFRIPFANKKTILRELNDLGISSFTILPEFDGLCKSINYFKLRLRDE